MFTLEFSEMVAEHLRELRAFDRKQILDQIDAQLTHQPTEETRKQEETRRVNSPLGTGGTVWELRIGEFRVFYDVYEEEFAW